METIKDIIAVLSIATIICGAGFVLYAIVRFFWEAGQYFERENEKAKAIEETQEGEGKRTVRESLVVSCFSSAVWELFSGCSTSVSGTVLPSNCGYTPHG